MKKIILTLLIASPVFAQKKFEIKPEWQECQTVKQCKMVAVNCNKVGVISEKFISQYLKEFQEFMKSRLPEGMACSMKKEDFDKAKEKIKLHCYKGKCQMRLLPTSKAKS